MCLLGGSVLSISSMLRHLLEVDEVAERIRRGEPLLLAGDESRLKLLPRGDWIAGTIPYFMSDEGGVSQRRRVVAGCRREGSGPGGQSRPRCATPPSSLMK